MNSRQLSVVGCQKVWKAQGRLCQRYRRLIARGKNANQVAIAREMAAFVWASARTVEGVQ